MGILRFLSPAPSAESGVAPTSPAGRYYPALDGVRGIAVLLVMLLHFTLFVPNGMIEAGLHQLLSAGWVGVDVFFVLSGFLITGILYDTRTDPHFFRNFYARRTLRIFPLYYAYLFLLFIVLPLFVASYAQEFEESGTQIWLWTYLGNFLMGFEGWEGMPSHTTHLWSLAVEEQFYLVWPLLVFMIKPAHLGRLCAVTFGLALLTRLYLVSIGAASAAYVLTPARMDTLAAGALIAVVMRQHGPAATRELARSLLWIGGALVLAASVWTFIAGEARFLAPLDPATQLVAYPGLALVFASLIGHVVTMDASSPAKGFLCSAPLLALGKYSYAAYMIHVPLRNGVRLFIESRGGLPSIWGSQLPAQIMLTLFGILLTLGLAWLSWHLFEKRILTFKRYFAAHPAAPENTRNEVSARDGAHGLAEKNPLRSEPAS